MAYTLSRKPPPGAFINWSLAPASLAACAPLVQGEDLLTPVDPTTGLQTNLEYVTRQACSPWTFANNTFGVTTWQSYGVNMNGGGVAGARAVEMPTSVLAGLNPHRRTIAWAQRQLIVANDTCVLYNGGGGSSAFVVLAPFLAFGASDIWLSFGPKTDPPDPVTDDLGVTTAIPLLNEWHSIMVSWSDGTGADPRTGMAIWDNGVLVASKSTHTNPLSPGSPDSIQMVGFAAAAEADFEYWYQFDEFIPSGNDLAMQLFQDPYWFFGSSPVRGTCGAAFTVNPCPEEC